MTPTLNDSQGDDSLEHRRIDPPTVPIPLQQTRRTPRLRTLRLVLRHPRPARPSTVWPCAQDDLREGTGLLADWLLIAAIKIVTSYTQPGQRVLLLDPAPCLAPPASWSATATHKQSRPSPYAGLHQAGWTVVRLGRGIQTQTAVARPDRVDEHTMEVPAESESGPGFPSEGPFSEGTVGPSADRGREPDSAPTGHGPDRYDLIITAADPRTLNWFHSTYCAGLLTPTGTLAVITRGDRSGGRLADPAGALVRAAQHAGLRYLDRIALLRVPVRDGVLATEAQATRALSTAPSGRSMISVQVHEDLFVFTCQPAPTGAADGAEA
ncbi:hypothetical protein DMH04_50020 [Kibdelosporangium aridum]|uniref:Uncharacterized protein n=1 Tax=Kibdelosporangium aridum TaxID=2030 RepID=A0A428YBZ4_KIBAR|nr:hypothetical protein [Kibdelosporangium aridum]RSM65000.1 hypothetical protein DMH04_50020 [Kibdelosporangium aridum]